MLIFVQSKERAKELYKELAFDDIKADVIHADLTQQQVSTNCMSLSVSTDLSRKRSPPAVGTYAGLDYTGTIGFVNMDLSSIVQFSTKTKAS